MYEQDIAPDTSSVPGSDHVNEEANPTQDFADMTLAEGWRAFWRSSGACISLDNGYHSGGGRTSTGR